MKIKEVRQTISGTISKRLDRLFLRVALLCRMKNFWAWLATWVGVLDTTKFRAIPRQSPLPNFWRPIKNSRCSSSVHGTPKNRRHKTHKPNCFSKLLHPSHYHWPYCNFLIVPFYLAILKVSFINIKCPIVSLSTLQIYNTRMQEKCRQLRVEK